MSEAPIGAAEQAPLGISEGPPPENRLVAPDVGPQLVRMKRDGRDDEVMP